MELIRFIFFFFFSSRRRHTRSLCDWSSDVCSSDLLRALGVEPWTELPLWAPEDEMAGAWLTGTERARRAGLRCRPVAETVADVAAWLRDGGAAALSGWGSHARPAPMT